MMSGDWGEMLLKNVEFKLSVDLQMFTISFTKKMG